MSLPFISLSLQDHGDAHTGVKKSRDEIRRDAEIKKRLAAIRKANAAREKQAKPKQGEGEALPKRPRQLAKGGKTKADPTPAPAPASATTPFGESDEDEDRRPVAGAGEASQPSPPPVEEADDGYDSWGGWTDDDEEEPPREVGPFARAFLEAKAKKEREDKEAESKRKAEQREAEAAERRRLQEREAQRQRERQEREKQRPPERDDELERMLDMFNTAKRVP